MEYAPDEFASESPPVCRRLDSPHDRFIWARQALQIRPSRCAPKKELDQQAQHRRAGRRRSCVDDVEQIERETAGPLRPSLSVRRSARQFF